MIDALAPAERLAFVFHEKVAWDFTITNSRVSRVHMVADEHSLNELELALLD